MSDSSFRSYLKLNDRPRNGLRILLAIFAISTITGLSAREAAVLTREVSVFFIDRDRIVDDYDPNLDYGEVLKLERYILDSSGRGYQPIVFHEGWLTGPWLTARTENGLQFYRQETDEDGRYVYVPDFAVEIPGGQEKILLVVDRSSGNGPMIHVIGLADLRGNEGLLLCNFSDEKLFFKLGRENPVVLSAGEIRHLPANRDREGNTVRMMAVRDKNGEADVIYNTIRRLRRDNLSVTIVTKASKNDFRFQHLQP